MESSTGLMDAPARRDPGVVRLTKIGLGIALLGALLMIFDLFSAAEVGLVLIVIATLLATRGGLGRSWYTALSIGAVLAVIARLLAESHETLGGWLAVIATVMVLVGVSLGYPLDSDEPE
jgi:hypothetical protein